MIENNGFYDLTEAAYHADPAPFPSLSSTFASDLVEKTEIEARMGQRRLNPDYDGEGSDAMDFGTLAHDYILSGGTTKFEVAPFDSWRTNAAKAAKEEIEARGLIALNESSSGKIVPKLVAMDAALRDQIAHHRDFRGIMQKGRAEQSAFCFDGLIWNRARFDWIDETYPHLIVDYKTTAMTFDAWEKSELWGGKYIQNPHYRHVYDTITGEKSRFIFLVQRTVAPHLIKIFHLDENYDPQIAARYQEARQRLAHCLKTGVWRGEPPYAVHAAPPPWVTSKWDIAEMDLAATKTRSDETPDVIFAG